MLLDSTDRWDSPFEFLYALNASPTFLPSFVPHHIEVDPPNTRTNPTPYAWPVSKGPRDPKLDEEAKDAYVFWLRQLADSWIESGRHGTTEDAQSRRLTPELLTSLEEWANRNPARIGFDSTGETVLVMPSVPLNYRAPLDVARDLAFLLFQQFLESPYRVRLFKCQSCGSYYFTERSPKGPIKYGTQCALHRQAASARRSNEKHRIGAHKSKITLAARHWAKWPPSMVNDGERLAWVADQVNGELRQTESWIKRHWVTRHRSEIEKAAEGIQHAEG